MADIFKNRSSEKIKGVIEVREVNGSRLDYRNKMKAGYRKPDYNTLIFII
jgi:hypothetical protein